MKKLLLAIAAILFVFTTTYPVMAKDCVPGIANLENETAVLSGMTRIVNDQVGPRAIMTIFSGLSVSDTKRFWSDIQVLKTKDVYNIDLWINSPGGDAFTGLALADEIQTAKREGFVITAHASGIIASAAVPVFAVCSKRYAKSSTIFMVHEAALWKWPGRETASDIRSQGKLMDLLQKTYLGILVKNSSLDFDAWVIMEAKTSWFGAKFAKSIKLVDALE